MPGKVGWRWAFTLLVAAGTSALAADEVSVVEARSIPGEEIRPGATHELRLTLMLFRDGLWTPGVVTAAGLEAARLFGQCGVAFAGLELRIVDAPRRYHFYSTPVSRELLRRLPVAKPAVFFVDDTHNRPAFDAEAIGRANAGSRPELADTVWVAHGARDLPLVVAHELAHVLADSGEHSDQPGNLMRADTAPENTRLTAAQCERLRQRGEANGLLARKG